MPKVKRRYSSDFEEDAKPEPKSLKLGGCSEASSSQQPGSGDSEPQRKRQKTSLNFSIESIMQSPMVTANEQQHRSSLLVAAAAAMSNHLSSQRDSSSPSSSSNGSESGRNSSVSSPSHTNSVKVEQTDSNGCKRLASPAYSVASGLTLSNGGDSRASTPISPGRNNSECIKSEVQAYFSTQATSSSGHRSSASNFNGSLKNIPQIHQDTSRRSNPSTKSQPGASSSVASRLSAVECTLDNKEMWDKFHGLNTEMIITKTGRRMFPVMKVQFRNLDPNARYLVSMDIVPVDNRRYRYAYHRSSWQVAGKADPLVPSHPYAHPDSPFNGDLLSRQVISFEKVKLTNNEMDKSGHIILNSMHKYQPRIHLILLKSTPSQQTSIAHHQQSQMESDGHRTFVFPETVFTAVTAYQNQLITKMKIDKNPFAKGFRDSSRLSDLDRNDPFDYIGSMGPSARFIGPPGPASALDIASAAAAGAQMDAYQLLASATNNPWYSAAAVAAAATGGNPLNPMSAASSTAQFQMWLAAVSACINQGSGPSGTSVPVTGGANTSAASAGLPGHLGQTKDTSLR